MGVYEKQIVLISRLTPNGRQKISWILAEMLVYQGSYIEVR